MKVITNSPVDVLNKKMKFGGKNETFRSYLIYFSIKL